MDTFCRSSRQKPGINVKGIASATAQALDTARGGDGDVAVVDANAQEEGLAAEGFGLAY